MGMDIDKEGRVKSLATNNSELGRLANGGIYLVKTSAVPQSYKSAHNKISLEDDIFPRMMNNRALMFGMSFEGRFIDIGVPYDYQRAAEVLCRHGDNS
jgi:D-glycero-alpha-D-manno-heptose 1-phosphate guanylyltransferase